MLIRFVNQFSGRRLRARRVDETAFAELTARRAIESDDWVFAVDHGGGVASSYGFSAETECVLAVSNPFGVVVCWTARAWANKISDRGAAAACLPSSGEYFDLRVKGDRKSLAREFLMSAFHNYVSDMEVVAVAASLPK